MAYKGTSLFMPDEDLFEILQISRDAGVLVMVHAENGDVIAKLQQQALARGDVDPIWHARTRPEGVEAEATARAIRLAEIAGAPLAVVHVTCADAAEQIRRAHARGVTVHGETCPQYLVLSEDDLARPDFDGAKYVCSPPLRDASNQEPLWRRLHNGDLVLVGSDHCAFDFAGQKEMGRGDFTKIPNGMPGVEERAALLWTNGVRTGRISPERFVAVLSTNQAHVHGLAPRKGLIVPGAEADIVVWDPDQASTITHANRHGGNDYSPYEGHRARRAAPSASTCAACSRSTTERWSRRPDRGGSCRGRSPHRGARSPHDARRAARPPAAARARAAHRGRGRRAARGVDRPLARGSGLAARPAGGDPRRRGPHRPGREHLGNAAGRRASAAW